MTLTNKHPITSKGCFEIYINDVLHLSIQRNLYGGLRSWREPMDKYQYKIQITLKECQPMLLEYDTAEKWEQVLKELQKI